MTAPNGVLVSDEDLVAAVADGDDPAAVEELYRRHWDANLLFAKRLMANDFDAEDIASESFLKVLAAIRRGLGPRGPFRPYMFRAVRSCAADHWGAQARHSADGDVEAAPEEDPGYARVLDEADRSLAASAFATLPVRWQTVLWHLDVEGDPPRRLAPLLGLEPNAVSAIAARARRGLRQAYLQAYVAGSLDEACEPTLPLLAKSVVENLTGREARKLRIHIDRCLKCRAALGDLEDVSSTMRRAVGPWFVGPLIPFLGLTGAGQIGSLPADPASWIAAQTALTQLSLAAASVAVVSGIATAVVAPTLPTPPSGVSVTAGAQVAVSPENSTGQPAGSNPMPGAKVLAPGSSADPSAVPRTATPGNPDQGQLGTDSEAFAMISPSPQAPAAQLPVLLPGVLPPAVTDPLAGVLLPGVLPPAVTDPLAGVLPSSPIPLVTLAPAPDPTVAPVPTVTPIPTNPDGNCAVIIVVSICLDS
ncbi:sigma-70 family RNA polymerase sigma factor [Arthrobacter sp. R1-13]